MGRCTRIENGAEPQRIVIVISSLAVGGAERSAVHLANAFAGEDYDVQILTFEATDAASSARTTVSTVDPAVKVQHLNLTGDSDSLRAAAKANWRRIVRLRDAVVRCSPALVISFVHVTNVLTTLALLGTRLTVVVCEESEPSCSPRSKIWRLLRCLSYPLAKRLVVHSAGALRWFARLPLVRAQVIPNAVALPESAQLGDRAERESIVLSVGRLGYEKGYDILIPAFAQATADRPEWRLLIVGEGAERKPLERIVEQLNLAERVSLPGRQSDPWTFYKTATIFVSSSRHEGFGMALCEAMACGCAVVATDCPSGPREIVADGVNGLIVGAGKVDELAAALRRLIDDAELRERLAAKAPEVAERFHPEGVKREWLGLLHELNVA